MSGSHPVGITEKVTVVALDGNQLMITFDDLGHEQLAEYFKSGGKFVARFIPAPAGDLASAGGSQS